MSVCPQGKLEDRKPFMLLFDDVAIDYILSAAQWAQLLPSVVLFLCMTFAVCPWYWTVCLRLLSGLQMRWQFAKNPLNHSKYCWCSAREELLRWIYYTFSDAVPFTCRPVVIERRYVFLKRLCQVLCALGGQLCALVASSTHCTSLLIIARAMAKCRANPVSNDVAFLTQGSDVEVEVPANIGKYMEALFAFTTHASQVTRHSDGCSPTNSLYTFADSFFLPSAGSKVVHPQYLGKLVQARDSVEGSGRPRHGRQIRQSVHGQSAQSETSDVNGVDPGLCDSGKESNLRFVCFFFFFWLGWIPISER